MRHCDLSLRYADAVDPEVSESGIVDKEGTIQAPFVAIGKLQHGTRVR